MTLYGESVLFSFILILLTLKIKLHTIGMCLQVTFNREPRLIGLYK